MGQNISKSEEIEKQNIYANYPGLEQQLDMVFACHDISKDGKLPYATVEMILRHFLMQCGFMEYVCRFVNEEVLVFLKKISDTYIEDQSKWMEKMKSSQEEQGKALEEAMYEYEKNILFNHSIKEQQLPASSAPCGACTSAGAVTPHRRYKEPYDSWFINPFIFVTLFVYIAFFF